jgi:hypothetical protein
MLIRRLTDSPGFPKHLPRANGGRFAMGERLQRGRTFQAARLGDSIGHGCAGHRPAPGLGSLPAHSRIYLFARVRSTRAPKPSSMSSRNNLPDRISSWSSTVSPRCTDLVLIFRCAPYSQELNPKEDPGMKFARLAWDLSHSG